MSCRGKEATAGARKQEGGRTGGQARPSLSRGPWMPRSFQEGPGTHARPPPPASLAGAPGCPGAVTTLWGPGATGRGLEREGERPEEGRTPSPDSGPCSSRMRPREPCALASRLGRQSWEGGAPQRLGGQSSIVLHALLCRPPQVVWMTQPQCQRRQSTRPRSRVLQVPKLSTRPLAISR